MIMLCNPLQSTFTPRHQSVMCQLVVSTEISRSAYLGREVESQVAVVCKRVLNHERHISRKAQLDSA